MIKLKLYNFNKKPNSTKIPLVSEGTSFNCTIKNISSILSPEVDIAVGPTNMASYNYAYIQEFDRYYFITDIVYDQGLWSLSLSCDLLATYREDILDSDQYIIRSTNMYDPKIIDSMYLTKNMPFASRSQSIEYAGLEEGGVLNPYGVAYRWLTGSGGGSVSDYFNATISTGDYVVGIIGNNATGVDYYVFTYAGLKELIRKAFAIRPSDMADVSGGVAQALYNPLQYITMCKWYPFVASTDIGTEMTSMYIGPYEITNLSNGPKPLNINKIPKFYMDIELPIHPDATDYPYLKLSPYSEYNLYFQPFGNIPIDSTKIADSEELTVTWTIDYATGLSNLIIRQNIIQVTGDNSIIYNATADYGVDIPISSLVTDFKTGAIISGLNWIKSIASDRVSQNTQASSMPSDPRSSWHAKIDMPTVADITSNIINKNTEVIDKAIDTLGSYMGQIHTVGSSGSFLAYVGKPFVYAYFFDQADRDPDRYGRPYYTIDTLYNISGYCLCSNAYINFSAKHPTITEYNAIISMLNTGIYIEA